jgi:dihydrofolate synthase/folylpolyglutamate synthase
LELIIYRLVVANTLLVRTNQAINIHSLAAGFCEDKDITEMLSYMPKDAHYIFTRAESRRAATAESIAAIASALGLDFEYQPTVATAVERAKCLMTSSDTLFVGGSTFVVAEILPQ